MRLKRLAGWGAVAVATTVLPGTRALAQREGALGPMNQKQPVASVRFGGVGDNGPTGPNMRTLEGQVKDAAEKPLAGAQVFMKNLKTSNMLSVIADEKGNFRFVALVKDVDYQFWAEDQKRKSETKTISSFDDTMQIHRNLTITAKPATVEPAAKQGAGNQAVPK